MYKQLLVYFLFAICTSCNYFSPNTKERIKKLDTIIDFTKVDVSPSFKVCDELMDEVKTNCFRSNMRLHITRNLSPLHFSTKKSVNETIVVTLLIDKTGKVRLKEIRHSDFIKEKFPDLVKLVKTAIVRLPQLHPAIKRGIPVATQYHLPIKIQTK